MVRADHGVREVAGDVGEDLLGLGGVGRLVVVEGRQEAGQPTDRLELRRGRAIGRLLQPGHSVGPGHVGPDQDQVDLADQAHGVLDVLRLSEGGAARRHQLSRVGLQLDQGQGRPAQHPDRRQRHHHAHRQPARQQHLRPQRGCRERRRLGSGLAPAPGHRCRRRPPAEHGHQR